jgi:transcriptional regulator with XRE-family HTH domain
MSEKPINDVVRHKLRQLRKQRKLTIKSVALGAGLPPSSYACMEHGFYNISLDNLHRILDVLDVDIAKVWPVTVPAEEASGYAHRIQQFRVQEVVSLSDAEGAALFSVKEGGCQLLLYHALPEFLLDRIQLFLERGQTFDEGVWFEKTTGAGSLHFFLKVPSCPSYITKLLQDYMSIWGAFFL